MKSKLRQLAESILENISILEEDCVSREVKIPDLNLASDGDPKNGIDFNRADPRILDAVNSISSAAFLLEQTVRSPSSVLRSVALGVR